MLPVAEKTCPFAVKVNSEYVFNWSGDGVTNGRITNETGSTAESQCGWLFLF